MDGLLALIGQHNISIKHIEEEKKSREILLWFFSQTNNLKEKSQSQSLKTTQNKLLASFPSPWILTAGRIVWLWD